MAKREVKLTTEMKKEEILSNLRWANAL